MLGLLSRFIDNAKRNYEKEGVSGLKNTFDLTTHIITETVLDHTTTRLARRGAENVYERPWDVLILLDCARVDMMKEVADEYEFITDVGELKSVGGHSREWMEYTFTDDYGEEIENTLYVNANTASDRALNLDDFLYVDEVWRDGWDEEYKTILPQTVTDRAISLHRELDPDRTIIHYMQPHTPFIPFPEIGSRQVTGPGIEGEYGRHVPELAEEYSREELWEFHIENLRYVLDNIKLLLSNLDADRVVISSDHGQALGEKGVWGHPRGSFVDTVRQVPWVVTSASDTAEYEPEYEMIDSAQKDDSELSVEDKLKYLGYKPR